MCNTAALLPARL